MLLLAGVPVHVVAERLGHADPSVTLRVYARVVRQHAAGVADAFASAVQSGPTLRLVGADDEATSNGPDEGSRAVAMARCHCCCQ